MLETNTHVHLISLDMSKAFDTVRHGSVLSKLAGLQIPDAVYNWVLNFLLRRSHTTKHKGTMSGKEDINASVVQGSAVGPIAFILNASDLHAINSENATFKYADDTFLIVPASNANTIAQELQHITSWAEQNNLRINQAKTHELLVQKTDMHKKNLNIFETGLPRIKQLKILGVTVHRMT